MPQRERRIMSAVEVDDDKILVILQKASQKAEGCKKLMQEYVVLANQCQGIRKIDDTKLPISALTHKPMTPELRKIIYNDILEASTRLNIQ